VREWNTLKIKTNKVKLKAKQKESEKEMSTLAEKSKVGWGDVFKGCRLCRLLFQHPSEVGVGEGVIGGALELDPRGRP
jgi:hypothetical protein